MPHTEQPKCCAVCWEPLDRVQTTNDQITFDKTNNWLHAGELVRPRDHPAIPVDYDDEKVQVVCDFCKAEVNRSTCFSVPAKDFTVPVIPHRSIGSWATCPDCAELVRANDWDALVDRAAKLRWASLRATSRGSGSTICTNCWLRT
jgi:hypothetical protein